jgi:hypothetical protein
MVIVSYFLQAKTLFPLWHKTFLLMESKINLERRDSHSDGDDSEDEDEDDYYNLDPKAMRNIRDHPDPPPDVKLESILAILGNMLPCLESNIKWDGNDIVLEYESLLREFDLKRDCDYTGMQNQEGSQTIIERPPIEKFVVWKCISNPDMELKITAHDLSASQFSEKNEIWRKEPYEYLSSETKLSENMINGIYVPPTVLDNPVIIPVRCTPSKFSKIIRNIVPLLIRCKSQSMGNERGGTVT